MRITIVVTADKRKHAIKLLKQALRHYEYGGENYFLIDPKGDYSVQVMPGVSPGSGIRAEPSRG